MGHHYVTEEEILAVSPKKKRLTKKQLVYIEAIAQGLTQPEARLKAGMTSRAAAYRCLQNPRAQDYLASIRAESRAITGHSVAVAMEETLEVIKLAKEQKNPMAYCKAVELRAKLSGLLIDRVEVFTADLKGALLEASKRIINVSPNSPALEQMIEASLQADSTTT